MPEPVRLQKVLSSAGVASRRVAEELIASGRVEVNGQVVDVLGSRVDPERDLIRVDGKRVVLESSKTYLALNKPTGVVSTMRDPQGRRCLDEFVRDRGERLYHVGRLDTETEGLILLVNDGDFAHRMTHPSYGVEKTYVAEVSGSVAKSVGKRLREGVELDDGPVRADGFRVLEQLGGKAIVEIVVHEGRKHIVRRMLAEVGHPVRRLVRTAIGPIRLGDLPPGKSRELTSKELGTLLDALEL